MDEQPQRRATDIPADAPWYVKVFVEGAGEFWKWLSTWFTAIAAAAPLLYANISDLQASISPKTFHYIETGLVLLIFFGRIKRQPPSKE